MIKLVSLHKSFQDGHQNVEVLRGVNFSLAAGASLSIQGESGSGKSTLLHLLAALDKPDSGEIWLDNQRLDHFNEKQADTYRKQQIGIVFQQFNLIDCLSVWDNVCFPMRLNASFDKPFVEHLLESLKMTGHAHKLPSELSGGEQQRVAIARSLAHRPRLLLADEPTGNLDDKNSQMVSELLFGLCKQLNTTLMLVTHSSELAALAQVHTRLFNGQLDPLT